MFITKVITFIYILCAIGCISCLNITNIPINGGAGSIDTTLHPCETQYFSVDIADTSKTEFLLVNTLFNVDTLKVFVSNEEYSSTMVLDQAFPPILFVGTSPSNCYNCITSIDVSVICGYQSSSTWYITLEYVDSGFPLHASGTISVNEISFPLNEIQTGTPFEITGDHISTNFANSFDFFHFTLPQTIALGEYLNITISDSSTAIGNIAFAKTNIPVAGYESNWCNNGASTDSMSLIIDYCELNSLVVTTGSDYYIAVQPVENEQITYNITVQTQSPSITPISVNTIPNTVFSVLPDQVNYYSFSANQEDEQLINATISNIQSGSLDFAIEYGTLPFVECLSSSSCNPNLANCCDDVNNICELVVQPCRATQGTYYLGVRVSVNNTANVPVTYQLQVDVTEAPDSDNIDESVFTSNAIGQAHYHFYEFDSNGFGDADDATFNIHLYVDKTAQPGTETIMYLNYDNFAGANSSCWENIAACSVVDEGACTLQLSPCLYNEHDTWYVSVFGGNSTTFYGTNTEYTLLAKLVSPVELSDSYLVINSAVYNGLFQHFHLDDNLLPQGGKITFLVFDVTGGDLEVYLNYGGLAGPTTTCPICYNNTDSQTTSSDTLMWSIANCDDFVNDNKDEIYFSVQGIADDDDANSDYVSFSLTVVAESNDIEPLDTLSQNSVLVDSIQGLSNKNYSVSGDSDSANAYLQVSLSQVTKTGTSPLVLTVYNTTNLNCMDDSYEQHCTIDNNGYCTLVIQNCNFNTSVDGWIAKVMNPNSEEVFYNIFYNIVSNSPNELENGQTYASTVSQHVYEQFTYEAIGSDTLIIEVFFDYCKIADDDDSAPDRDCIGSLFVSTAGPTGPSGCFFNDFEDSDTDKVVFVTSSCDLPAETFYFSVGTSSNLYPDFPLGYTVKVTEMSSSISTQVNVPMSAQIYPKQKIYHTFTNNVAPSVGSRIDILIENEESSNVNAVLSTGPPPSSSGTCPCFEYGTDLSVDYCESSSTNTQWSVLVQTSGGPDNVQVGYTISILYLTETPVLLSISTNANPVNPIDASVAYKMYNYYSLSSTISDSTQLTLSISNIQGGAITVYYSSSNPATANCMLGELCLSRTDECVTQLGNTCLGTPKYISVYADNTNSFDPISYSIQLSENEAILLQANAVSAIQYLSGSFKQFYNFTIADTYTAPQVTVTINDPLGESGENYSITLFENDVCSTPIDSNGPCSGSCSVTDSSCDMGTSFYFSITNNFDNTLNYTISVDVVDIAASSQNLVSQNNGGNSVTLQFNPNSWKTITTNIAGAQYHQSFKYSIVVNDTVDVYFAEQALYATPDCNDNDDDDSIVSSGSKTINECCLEDGNYALSIFASDFTNVTVTFELVDQFTNLVTFDNSLPTQSYPIESLETQTFSFTLNETSSYELFWILVTTNITSNVFIQQASTAGPTLSSFYCSSNIFTRTNTEVYYPSNQCNSVTSIVNSWEGGTFYIGVQNRQTSQVDMDISIESGVQRIVSIDSTILSVTADPYLTYYYSYTVANLTATQKLEITVGSDEDLPVFLYNDSPCGSPITTCTRVNDYCTLTVDTLCEGVGTYIVTVESPSSGTTFNITANMVDKYPTNTVTLSNTPVSVVNTTIFAIASVPAVGNENYAKLTLSNYDGSPDGEVTITYSIEGMPNCANPIPELICTDDDDELNSCYSIFDNCLLAQGTYYFTIIAANTYDVKFEILSQPSTSITVPSVTQGTAFENDRITYNLTLDYNTLLPGQGINITLTNFCGESVFYLNQGSVPGPSCASSSSSSNIIIDPCSLLSSPIANYENSDYFITVIGGETIYPSLSLPNQYTLQAKLFGPPATFLSAGENEVIPFEGQHVIYSYPIPGLEDFVGQLEIILVGSGMNANLEINYDIPTICGNSAALQVGSINHMDKLVLNSCFLDTVRIIYLSFTAGSDTNANFQITHVKPFIRDLDVYTSSPQMGAVVPSVVSSSTVVDEEYYRISLDPTVMGFQFTAYLESDDTDIQIMSSQQFPPSLCNTTDDDDDDIQTGRSITWDWCELELTKELYLTVNYPSSSMGQNPKPYSLYFSTSSNVEITSLTVNVPICDTVAGGSWKYYTAIGNTNINTQYTAEVYSINSDSSSCTLTSYISFDGLAEPPCDVDSMTCSGTCSGSSNSCTYNIDCPIDTNITLSVFNEGNDDVNYFVVWRSNTIQFTGLTVNTPVVSTTNEEYFQLTLPALDVTSQLLMISAVINDEDDDDDDDSISMGMSINFAPGSSCTEYTGIEETESVYIIVDSCNYVTANTAYIYVDSDKSFTMTAILQDLPVSSLNLDTFAETSLTAANSTFDSVTYKISITQDMIASSTSGMMDISIYGVNQGQVRVWVSANQIGGSSCAIASPLVETSTLIQINSCAFAAGDYYVTAFLTPDLQNSFCTPVTIGVMASMGTDNTPVTALTSGNPVTAPYPLDSDDYYSFSSTQSIVQVSVTSSVPVNTQLWTPGYVASSATNLPNICSIPIDNISYFWGCEQIATDFRVKVSTPISSTLILPDNTYTIDITESGFTNITDTPVTGKSFTSSYESMHFYVFTHNGNEDSVNINIEVTRGPAVVLEIWDTNCLGSNIRLSSLTCYYGYCNMPFSWGNGGQFNSSNEYYITVSGFNPSSYNLQVLAGESETCFEIPNTDLCDVSWSIWNYNSGERGLDHLNTAALRFYNELADKFCPPCACPEISQSCNNSLIEYTCTQTYRACSDNGLQTSICEDSCQDIEENCGMTFEQVGLPWLSCNHNFYYSGSDEICTDIYGVSDTDSSDIVLWIVVVIVFLLVALIIAGVIGFLAFKKYKQKRQDNAAYESIGSAPEDED